MTPQSYREAQIKGYLAIITMALSVAAFIAFCITHPVKTEVLTIEERTDSWMTIGEKLYTCHKGKLSYYRIDPRSPIEWPKGSPDHVQMASIRLTNETKNYFVLCNGDKLEANP